MGNAAGYVVVLTKKRRDVFDNNHYENFAEPVPEFQHSRNLPLVCFVVNDKKLVTHIASGRRGNLAGTDLRRLNLEKIRPISESVTIENIVSLCEKRVQSKVTERLTFGGLLPPKSFQSVIKALTELAPSIRSKLIAYTEARIRRISSIPAVAREALAQQKEAVVTALSLADIEKTELRDWDLPKSLEVTSYLDGLSQVRLREDPMVIHDQANMPGFDSIKQFGKTSSTVFENDTSKLTVTLANHLPLEEQLGTDLIYYNETFSCFLMVQYKAMEKDKDDTIFRFPNAQFDKEMARMENTILELSKCKKNEVADGYRLTENPFFLKICPRIIFNPDSTGLVPGMYLPLDYWKLIKDHESMKGPKGGKRISYRNVRRYLDNSSFITIASQAWIGSNIEQSKELAALIRSILEGGRAVVFAVASDKELRHHGDS